jgi:O-antigen/teichoic acid export membrane protein
VTQQRKALVALNAATSVLRMAVTMVVGVLLMAVLVRHVGVEEYGLWTLVNSVVGFFGLMELGFAATVVRYVSEARGRGDVTRRNEVASTVLAVYLGLTVVAALAVALLGVVFNDVFDIVEDKHVRALLLLWLLAARNVLFAMPVEVYRGVLFGEQKAYLTNVVSGTMFVAYGLASWIALAAGHGLVAVGVIGAAATLVEGAIVVALAHARVEGFEASWSHARRDRLQDMLSFSAWQVVVNVANLILLRIDPVLVGLYLPLGAVGIYGAAMKIAEYTVLIVKQITNSLTPTIGEMHGAGDLPGKATVLVRGTRWALAAMMVMAVPITVHADHLIEVWMGAEMLAAVPLLRVLMLGMLAYTPYLLACDTLFMTGHHRFASVAALVTVIAHVGLAVVLLPRLELMGVVIASVVAVVAVDIGVTLTYACSRLRVPAGQYLRAAVLPAVACAVPQALVGIALEAVLPDGANLVKLLACVAPGVAVFLAVFWRWFVEADAKEMIQDRLDRVVGRVAGANGDAA